MAIDGSLYSINALSGQIFRSKNDGEGEAELFFDVATDLPEGLTIDPSFSEGIANIVGGRGNKFYVAFTGDTLPEIKGKGNQKKFSVMDLPDFKQPGVVPVNPTFNPFDPIKEVDDLYRLEEDDLSGLFPFIPDNFGLKYQVIYEFNTAGGELKNGKPISAFEVQSSATGHRGTGMEFTPDGKILWATGDNLPFGLNGRKGAQLDEELPSKLFLIDPRTGEVELAAKGLRNVQHLEIAEFDGELYLAFADIGGVVSEEVNVVPLDDILDTDHVENFGWGVAEDGLAREGTFYVGGDYDPDNPRENGIALILGSQPPATGFAGIGEEGFVQPIAQYGRVGPASFVAATGPVISEKSFGGALSVVFGDLASGEVLGTKERDLGAIDADVFRINLVDEDGTALESLNDFSSLDPNTGESLRSDPRFFTFNDGTAGVFLESTGEYFRLTEQSIYDGIA